LTTSWSRKDTIWQQFWNHDEDPHPFDNLLEPQTFEPQRYHVTPRGPKRSHLTTLRIPRGPH
jgi:hypothetical protein